MSINWYPGHMKKTKETIAENLKIVDLVIEVLDARIPLSSKNPDISKLAKNKKRLTVLNKVDLADEREVENWKEYFIRNDISDYVLAISAEKGTNLNELKRIVDEIYIEKLEKAKKKGLRKTEVRALIAGIPNVGKSKLINKFAGKTKARVGDKPGFTRGKQWVKASEKLELLDTPGVLWPKFDDPEVGYSLAITGSIKDDILPIEEVVSVFIDRMRKTGKLDQLVKAYNLETDIENKENHEILDILEERLGIIKKEETNYNKVSRFLLRDYRSGKLGKFSLETTQ
ncbi:Ribosome biogenesis GTPase A [Sebaldella termitidis]|jgi:ribosome biogenesis GTPase A|uniref:Ribosome biogenesis GTPase A n=1 Tax=Sebaldella termitidis (strain ATCC 33386 / NCTC 11300) TaxID=526218 RepID=D1AKQ5_SEBTE|nr:ribosome biogenesis GTPase YlqF [Sebaldella termitidis]ACZ07071.1 GTP-binding protein HSR1-related protein [Sebaldella termitidis ATCC 33386]SUI22361.1 Ribosome biogenesis GTPase A [Sebaldella termitidis]